MLPRIGSTSRRLGWIRSPGIHKRYFAQIAARPERPVFTNSLDRKIQQYLIAAFQRDETIPCSYDQYRQNARTILPNVVPYNARRGLSRPEEDGNEIALVIHAAEEDGDVKWDLCSGFAVIANEEEGCLIIACAHTLEGLRRDTHGPIRSFLLCASNSEQLIPIQSIPTSLPRLDLLVCRVAFDQAPIRALPVTPFPTYRGGAVHSARMTADHQPLLGDSTSPGKTRRLGEPASPWHRWEDGEMLGYRGDLWEEVDPGNDAHLPYILMSTLPTAGSSGGPILDTQSGAVIGMISGTRYDNRVEGQRGWGTSTEAILELFSLPGFIPASQKFKS